jgi:predicted dehydrogenase
VTNSVRALVAGAGLMGTWHAHAIRRSGATLAGVVDVDPVRASTLAARYGRARPFERLNEALKALRPDIVHVCTPLDSHAPLARAALEAGCHVIVEKPLTATAPETQELLMLAAETQRLLVPVHQFIWQRGALQVADRLPVIGPILHLEIGAASAGASAGPEAAADAVTADILPHFLALTRRFLGVALAEQRWSVEKPRPGEWSVTGRCGTVLVHYLLSMAARPTFAELRLLGSQGSARLDLFHGFALMERGAVSRGAKIARPFGVASQSLLAAAGNLARRAVERELAYPGLTELIRRVHQAASGTARNPIPPEETLDVARTRDVLVELSLGRDRG